MFIDNFVAKIERFENIAECTVFINWMFYQKQ